MKNLVLSVAKVVTAFLFYTLAVTVIIFLAVAWVKFIQEGNIPIGSKFLSVRILNKSIEQDELAKISDWLNAGYFRLWSFMIITSAVCILFVLPFNLIRKAVSDLKLNNWFVEANTNRLRTLGYFFASVWVAQFIISFLLSILVNHYFIGISIPGSPFWFAVTSFLLSYMNQQGVQQHQEVELTV